MGTTAERTGDKAGPRTATPPDFRTALDDAAAAVAAALERLLPAPDGLHARVHEAMRYAVFAGGKRLRPFLVLQSARLFAVEREHAVRVAAAIEALHTYSLVHDDLPCMDDDDLRRGRPTTHKAFDEATAVLAGDALLTMAFEILADDATHTSAAVRCRLVRELALAAGSNGMVGGQMIDMLAPDKTFGADDVILLQRLKTGALFEFCCVAGAILGEAGAADEARLRDYARDIGLTFQITDDLLDVLGSTEKTGKAVGKDKDQGKATLVSLWGIDAARDKAQTLARHAVETLAPYGTTAAALQALPGFLLDRDS
ncbi:polyprenyl synthetase family protein [Reyranella sp. CPCC 100927]|uniref:polyprenyl synthetase family protein n=1 Tax=Reyranella sp. CPCC 100927 TaxID=2599616 RepID=UPI0011B6EA3D|nr:farnesyl diphosphate synthase [Reyranella sp. CPCC 100927]TWT00734.1 polyprenyl synthetase family protein [Reyranella sp. CPCC 100927]